MLTTMIADGDWHSVQEHQPADDQAVFRVGQESLEIDVLRNDWRWTYDPAYSQATETVSRDDVKETLAVSAAENGTVQLTDDGKVLYQANEGFTGIDKFSYTTLHDGETTRADVYVNVVESLYALRDWFSIDAGSQNNLLNVLDNDGARQASSWRFSNETLSIVSVDTQGLNGTIQVTADGRNLIYTPNTDTAGEQTFRYTVEDAYGNESEATVYLEVDLESDGVSTRQLEQRLIEAAVDRYKYQFENPDGVFYGHPYIGDLWIEDRWRRMPAIEFDLAFATNRVAMESGQADIEFFSTTQISDATSASLTNNQETQVDEADLVKTDGSYLYMVSNWTDGAGEEHHQLVITDVRDRTQMNVVARYALDGPAEKLFLHDERVIVLSQESQNVNLTVLDVTDPTNPTLTFASEFSGQLSQARFVEDHVYVIARTIGQDQLPPIETHCYQQEVGCFFETATQYVSRIESIVADSLNASVTTTYADGSTTTDSVESITSLANTDVTHSFNASAIISFDIRGDDAGPKDSISVAHGFGSQVYVSPQSIVFFESTYRADNSELIHTAPSVTNIDLPQLANETVTAIQQVTFDGDGELVWAAAGAVPGRALNTFSFSEHDGYLRVATTQRDSSSVYVLAQDEHQLEIVGSLRDLAPGEQIYSVRFEGNRGFVVTFRQVDPLFVIDLSDPEQPNLLGELKVPGYSNYLQVIDQNHLLGIGRDANLQGRFQELQVSIFDISDLENPTLKHRFSFEGGRELWSPLMQDARTLGSHHSVNYFAEHETLVLPVYTGVGRFWGWEPDQSQQTVSMRVLDIDLEDGISDLGSVVFTESVDPQKLRAVRIGEDLLSVAPNIIKANRLREPDQSLGQLLIGAGATDDTFVIRGTETSRLNVMSNDLMPEGEAPLIEVQQPTEGGIASVSENGEIAFTPDPEFVGTVEFSYSIDGGDAASVSVEVKPQWHNNDRPLDVNDDGQTTVRDLLQIINLLTDLGSGELARFDHYAIESAADAIFADVNQDGQINPRDALSMINHFAEQSSESLLAATPTNDSSVDHREESDPSKQTDEAIGQLF